MAHILSSKAKHFSIDSLISSKNKIESADCEKLSKGSLKINDNLFVNESSHPALDQMSDESSSCDSFKSDYEPLTTTINGHNQDSVSKEVVSSNESDSKRFSIEEVKSPVSIVSEDGWKMDEDLDKESKEGDKAKKVKDEGKSYSSQDSASKDKAKPEINLNILPKCNCQELTKVEAKLETKDLWEKFYELGTEMIITKTGRRMFPTLRLSFIGSDPHLRYIVLLDIVPVDSKRYRYAYHRSSWLPAGKADPPSPSRLYVHPDGPFTGDQLRKQVITFEKVKLTNNEMDKQGHIVLNSMHKYQPRIHLVLRDAQNANVPVTDLKCERFRTYIFPETIFTAVTAYQNQLITKLKIDSNPFAKGFRDSSRLTDLERETVESMMTNYRGYPRNQMISPFMMNGNETSSLTRDRAILSASCSSPTNSANILNLKPPMIWNSPLAFPQLNSQEVYNLLSASCQPWYLSPVFGAHLRSSSSSPASSNLSQSSAAALALASFPHLWSSSNSPLVTDLNRQSIISSSNGIGPIRTINSIESALQAIRYSPYFYSSPKKDLITNVTNNNQPVNQNSKTNCE